MRRLHYTILLLILWLSLVFNLERLAPPLQLAPFLYLFLPIASILAIWVVTRLGVALPLVMGGALLAYIVPRMWSDDIVTGAELTVVITELAVVLVTLLFSSAVGHRLREVRFTLANLVIGQVDDEIVSFERGQNALYREVRRARRKQHSLALLSISAADVRQNTVTQPSPDGPFPSHIISEMQFEFGRKFILTRIGRILLDKLEDSAVITQTDDHFVVLLPETTREELQTALQILQSAAEERLGLKLSIGSAAFPDEEITLESLIERAEARRVGTPVANAHQTYSASTSPMGLTSVDSSSNASSAS